MFQKFMVGKGKAFLNKNWNAAQLCKRVQHDKPKTFYKSLCNISSLCAVYTVESVRDFLCELCMKPHALEFKI